ncbi:hypothetical protein D3C85_993800 [compost metagenome]
MIEFLTHDEVCELTEARTRAGQILNLKKNGIRHTIKANGWPCVTVFAVTGQGAVPAEEKAPKWEPSLRFGGGIKRRMTTPRKQSHE